MKKAKMGRPPLPVGVRKGEYIQVRVSPVLHATVSRAAKEAGQKVPDFVRSLLQREVGDVQ